MFIFKTSKLNESQCLLTLNLSPHSLHASYSVVNQRSEHIATFIGLLAENAFRNVNQLIRFVEKMHFSKRLLMHLIHHHLLTINRLAIELCTDMLNNFRLFIFVFKKIQNYYASKEHYHIKCMSAPIGRTKNLKLQTMKLIHKKMH